VIQAQVAGIGDQVGQLVRPEHGGVKTARGGILAPGLGCLTAAALTAAARTAASMGSAQGWLAATDSPGAATSAAGTGMAARDLLWIACHTIDLDPH